MLKKIALVLSTLLHPMLMPTIGLLVIFSTQSHVTFIPFEFRRAVVIIVLVSTCILPLSALPIFLQTGVIKSLHMKTNKERILPLLVTGFFYIIGYYFIKRFQLPSFISLFILSSIVAVIIALVISFFWKVSIHMVGIGGVLGAVLAIAVKYGVDTSIWIIVGIAASGLLGSSRLVLKAHNNLQVATGFLIGLFVIYSVVLLK